MKVHCLFEQSGTFKNEFRKLGYEAFDYDIQNEFNQTDYVVDLFAEIEGGYNNKPSIFDDISKDDLILSFFPCTRFEAKIPLAFRGELPQMKNYTVYQKLDYSMRLHEELHEYYMLFCKMFYLVNKRGLQMIVENPYTQPHYLTSFFCIRPTIIDPDRTDRGDYYRKPTQFWFVNREPQNNFIFEPLEWVEIKTISHTSGKDGKSRQTQRSMIHPQYANRFIREFILKEQ